MKRNFHNQTVKKIKDAARREVKNEARDAKSLLTAPLVRMRRASRPKAGREGHGKQ
jgi:hypothetical protein